MAEISAKLVNELRQRSGAGMMDCKRALQEASGDMDKAILHLREKGVADAGKRSGRIAAEGKVEVLLVQEGKVGVLVEVNSETDFVSRGDAFQSFCKDITLKIAEASQAETSNAEAFSANVIEPIRKALVSKTGENVVVRRFVRFDLNGHGKVEAYLHMGGKIGVLVEAGCQSDAVAKGEHFTEFCREVAMQVAATNPKYLKRDEVPEAELKQERDIFRKQALDEGKPANVVEKILEGRVNKFYSEVCLIDQPYIREQKMSVDQLRKDLSAKAGENLEIRRFTRYLLGEGIEKKKTDLAAEVAEQLAKASKS